MIKIFTSVHSFSLVLLKAIFYRPDFVHLIQPLYIAVQQGHIKQQGVSSCCFQVVQIIAYRD